MNEPKPPAFDFSLMLETQKSSPEQGSKVEIIEEHDSSIVDNFEITVMEQETAHKTTIQALRDLRDFNITSGPKLKNIIEQIAALEQEKKTIETRMVKLEKQADEAVDHSITSLNTVLSAAKLDLSSMVK